MQQHLCLTSEQLSKKPESIVVMAEWGWIDVILFNPERKMVSGFHCFVEGPEKDLVEWLKKFDGVLVGNGVPMMESFQMMHVREV